mgnify:CR=1 FL=1
MSLAPTPALPSELVKRISREDMNRLPIRRYEGSVYVVARHPDLQHAMQDILQESVVGFDTEARPAFSPGESYPPLSRAIRHGERCVSLAGPAAGPSRRDG